jgi:CRP-like cAMP-binding protein
MPVGFMELLGTSDRDLILRRSKRASYRAGFVAHGGEGAPQLALFVERGLVRIFVQSDDGMQASVAYFHPGDIYATLDMLGPPTPAHVQAVVDSTVLLIDTAHLNHLATSSLAISQAAIQALGTELSHLVRIITVRSLGSMTERLAFDLLERASESQLREGQLTCQVTHEQLADSIGSAREVVTRILGDLRRSGVVATSPGRIRVLNAPRLSLIVRGLAGP